MCDLPAEIVETALASLRLVQLSDSFRTAVPGKGASLGIVRIRDEAQVRVQPLQAAPTINRAFEIAAGTLLPSFTWTSLQINSNTTADWHVDSCNKGLSVMIVLGNFTGGEFEVEGSSKLQLSGKAVLFDGRQKHRSHKFEGERWSIIAFTHFCWEKVGPKAKRELLEAGFRTQQGLPRAICLKTRFFLDLCAGKHAPLSRAVLELHKACLFAHDAHPLQGGAHHDLLDPSFFDFAVRLAKSGAVAFAAAAPPCADYSVLRFKPGGPEAVRSWTDMDAWPGCETWQMQDMQESQAVRANTASILSAVRSEGGHFSWENPPSSLALAEKCNVDLLSNSECDLIWVAACRHGMLLPKSWVFATTWRPLRTIMGICNHGERHPAFAGLRENGRFVSGSTAEYPPSLATQFAAAISPLLSDGSGLPIAWACALLDNPLDLPVRVPLVPAIPEVLYIGRGNERLERSKWANPFSLFCNNRSTALARFRRHLADSEPLQSALQELKGRFIACHCSLEERCHGDILIGAFLQKSARPPATAGKSHEVAETCSDGGGLPSTGDWGRPQSNKGDLLRGLRRRWLGLVSKHSLHKVLANHVENPSEDSPFDASIVQEAQDLLREEFPGLTDSHFSIEQGQPFRLKLVEFLLGIIKDPDSALPASMADGVPTGCVDPIPASGIWVPESDANRDCDPLVECDGNWQSAESDPELTQSLIDADVSEDFVFEIPGGMQEAKRRWGDLVAVGKLGVATADGRKPRLVMDSTAPGVNGRSKIEEKVFNATFQDVRKACKNAAASQWHALVLDVSKAHKRIKVRSQEQGLLLFSFHGRLYAYKVCHFGAKFSAYWWARFSACLHRLLHCRVYIDHKGFIYVDDWLWLLRSTTCPILACLIILFLLVIRCPMSWNKLAMGPRVVWLGLSWDFGSLRVSIPEAKLNKCLSLLNAISSSTSSMTRKSLESGTGLLLWVTQVFIRLRPFLAEFFGALSSKRGTLCSISPEEWRTILSNLDTALVFNGSRSAGPIQRGWKLLSIAHKPFLCLRDAQDHFFGPRRCWTRWHDPRSKKVNIHADLKEVATGLAAFIQKAPLSCPITPACPAKGSGAADAYATSSKAGIGGWFLLAEENNSPVEAFWFSEDLDVTDFPAAWDMKYDLQKYIASLELLAQLALLWARAGLAPSRSQAVALRHFSDNTPTEGAVNRLYSSSAPMKWFVQCFASWCEILNVEVQISHIQGESNIWADGLSRGFPNTLGLFKQERRIQIPVKELLTLQKDGPLIPAEANWPPVARALSQCIISCRASPPLGSR